MTRSAADVERLLRPWALALRQSFERSSLPAAWRWGSLLFRQGSPLGLRTRLDVQEFGGSPPEDPPEQEQRSQSRIDLTPLQLLVVPVGDPTPCRYVLLRQAQEPSGLAYVGPDTPEVGGKLHEGMVGKRVSLIQSSIVACFGQTWYRGWSTCWPLEGGCGSSAKRVWSRGSSSVSSSRERCCCRQRS